MNILITSAGRRVSLVRAFQKEIKTINPAAKVFAADADPQLSSACHVADGFFKVPRLNESEYFNVLKEICVDNAIAIVIPTIDTELLPMAINKSNFLQVGIQFLVSDEKFVRNCRDKRMIHKFFESHNVAVAKEYKKDKYELPLFIKPVDGSRSVDTFIIKKEEDLTAYHFNNDKLMFLEYIDQDEYDEFTCDMYFDKSNQLKCIVPRKRIEVRDGEVNKGLTKSNAIVPYIKQRMYTIPGAIGCLTAQFFAHKTNNSVFGIEINPRFGGGYPLSYHAGANFPKWILDEYIQNKLLPDSFECWENDMLMLRYDDEVIVHGYTGK